MSHKKRSTLEKKIQADIEAALGAERDLLLLRNSVGEAVYFDEKNVKEFHVPYGLGKGSPDIVGLLRVELRHRSDGDPVIVRKVDGKADAAFALTSPVVVGTWFCLEVKPPEGELEPDQEKCHRIWRRFGAFIETVRSVGEARAALERARRFES